jgi:hypothetical protein
LSVGVLEVEVEALPIVLEMQQAAVAAAEHTQNKHFPFLLVLT